MVIRKNLNSNALISVYDKSNLQKICLTLTKYNIGIISTGATAKKIISLGFKCKEVSSLTKFKEILDGRVKTLNPKIHASLLFKRSNINHEKVFKKLNFPKIDFVIVNFYPFSKISNKEVSSNGEISKYSLNLNFNQKIKDIKIIDENNILIFISDDDQASLIIYNLKQNKIISKIGN